MPFQLTLHGETIPDLVHELRWLAQQFTAIPRTPTGEIQDIASRAVTQPTGLEVRDTVNGGLGLFDPDDPTAAAGTAQGGSGGGPVTHPPEDRQRINDAAAKAKEALTQQRQAQRGKPRKTAQAASQGNGAVPETPPGQDLSGDPEDGDKEVSPDSEPNDPLAPEETADRTPKEKRDVLRQTLLLVHRKEEAKAGKGKTKEVLGLCKKFGANAVAEVPDAKVDEFWEAAQALCRKWGVPFVGETPAATETGML